MLRYMFIFIGVLFSGYSLANEDCDYGLPLGNIAACYEKKSEESDALLNDIYQKLKNTVIKSAYEESAKNIYWSTFVKSQRNWIEMRDHQCFAKGAFSEENTPFQGIEIHKCLYYSTQDRIIYLEKEINFIQNLP
ncbi:hypothetical protein ACS86_13545 [Vibrio alginolyticus]|nr:hypothetical protein ACS86_13545 [Vibrio alginolyticus]